jgi:alpha-beta hydrolase superfamily lysophospholipase
MKRIFKDESFYFEWLRTMGYAPYGGADVNECLSVAQKIKEGDFEGWYRQWFRLAEQLRGFAEQSEAGNHPVSAREAYFRASNYYRTSEFYLHSNLSDQRAYHAWAMSRACFRKGMALQENPGEVVEISYQKTFLPGYFFHANQGSERRPVIIGMTGFDGTAEEMYFNLGIAAQSRGYHFLSFEGPGQGGALREQKLYFRPDWEKVITAVVDYLVTRPEVDPNRIILAGYSFGGFLAPRAAAFEKRLAACIANGGIYDYFSGSILKSKPMPPYLRRELAKEDSPLLNMSTRWLMRRNTGMRWAIQDGLWKYNVSTPHQLMKEFQKYTLEGIVDRIQCPMLVCDSENESNFPGQAKILYEKLQCDKTWMVFTADDYTENHCQGGALLRSNQKIFDWLDERFQ